MKDLRCEYDPYHLHGLDSGVSHDLYREFYDAEDLKYGTGHMIPDGEDEEDDVPFEMVDDEMAMYDNDPDFWTTANLLYDEDKILNKLSFK